MEHSLINVRPNRLQAPKMPPTPSKVTFAAVAKKVMSAVSRPIGFVKALARLLPIVPSNANPLMLQ